MKLAHYNLEQVFDIVPGSVNVLVIEPEDRFYNCCAELCGQIAGEPGNFCLSEGDETLNLAKTAAVVSDYLSLSVNDKKFVPKLYHNLKEIAESRFAEEWQQINLSVTALFDKLNAESDCPIDYNEESGVQELFKAFGVCMRKEETLLENLLLFVRAHAFLLKTRCFFFINLKTVLTEKQLKDFYHETELAEICVFLLENTCKPKLPGETVTVIDRDLCEFLA